MRSRPSKRIFVAEDDRFRIARGPVQTGHGLPQGAQYFPSFENSNRRTSTTTTGRAPAHDIWRRGHRKTGTLLLPLLALFLSNIFSTLARPGGGLFVAARTIPSDPLRGLAGSAVSAKTTESTKGILSDHPSVNDPSSARSDLPAGTAPAGKERDHRAPSLREQSPSNLLQHTNNQNIPRALASHRAAATTSSPRSLASHVATTAPITTTPESAEQIAARIKNITQARNFEPVRTDMFQEVIPPSPLPEGAFDPCMGERPPTSVAEIEEQRMKEEEEERDSAAMWEAILVSLVGIGSSCRKEVGGGFGVVGRSLVSYKTWSHLSKKFANTISQCDIDMVSDYGISLPTGVSTVKEYR